MNNIQLDIEHQVPSVALPPLEINDLGKILLKHYDLHEGKFEVTVEFQIGVGAFGPDLDKRVPSAFVAVSRIGLRKVAAERADPAVLDAEIINPVKKKSRTKVT